MKKFEYNIFDAQHTFGSYWFDMDKLTEVGMQGWEVVCKLANGKQLLLKQEVEQTLNEETNKNAITEDDKMRMYLNEEKMY